MEERGSRIGRLFTSSEGCIKQRYILVIMLFFSSFVAYTLRICLSVAITEMVFPHNDTIEQNSTMGADELSCPADTVNGGVRNLNAALFSWDEEQQGKILSSFYWGYVVTQIPFGILSDKYGGKQILGIGILLSSIFSLVTPVVVRYGDATGIIIIRIISGLCQGPLFPAMNTILAQWIPIDERSLSGIISVAGCGIGTIFGTAASGYLIKGTQSWDSVFYFYGVVGILWYVLWHLLCYNKPNEHPYITDKEKQYLKDTITESQEMPPIPYKAIALSLPLWSLTISQIGTCFGLFALVTDLPKYMKDVLKFEIEQNGLLSSLPFISEFIASLICGRIGDWMIKRKISSVTHVRKAFTIVGASGCTVCLISASYAGCDRLSAVSCLILATLFKGTMQPGTGVNCMDLSPTYAGIVMGVPNCISSFMGILAPYAIGLLTTNRSLLEWRTVFWLTGGMMFFTNVFYLFTASGEVQPWDTPKKKRHQSEMETKNAPL